MNLSSILIVIGLSLVIVEIFTPSDFFVSSIGIAFIATSLFSSYIVDNSALLIVLSALSVFFFVFMRLWGSKKLEANIYGSNKDQYLGMEFKVQKILESGRVEVKVFSEVWQGVSEEKLSEGDLVEVKDIKGNTLILEKKH